MLEKNVISHKRQPRYVYSESFKIFWKHLLEHVLRVFVNRERGANVYSSMQTWEYVHLRVWKLTRQYVYVHVRTEIREKRECAACVWMCRWMRTNTRSSYTPAEVVRKFVLRWLKRKSKSACARMSGTHVRIRVCWFAKASVGDPRVYTRQNVGGRYMLGNARARMCYTRFVAFACVCVGVRSRSNPSSSYLTSQFSINDGELHCRTARNFSGLVNDNFPWNVDDKNIFNQLNREELSFQLVFLSAPNFLQFSLLSY